MARPSIPSATSVPQQGQVLCNTPVVQAAQAAGAVTVFCSQSLYHEGPHMIAAGLPSTQPKSIYNNK